MPPTKSDRELHPKAVKEIEARRGMGDSDVRRRILDSNPDVPDSFCGAKLSKQPVVKGVEGEEAHRCMASKGFRTDHAGFGTCIHHGGATPAGKKAAARDMGLALINEYKRHDAKFGGDRSDPLVASLTPEQVMLEEVRRSAAMVRFLEEKIQSWGVDAVQLSTIDSFVSWDSRNIRTKTEIREFLSTLGSDDPDSSGYLPDLVAINDKTGISASTNAKLWLDLYREERAHMVRVAKLTIDSGIAKRLVSIAEDQGRVLASALRVILDALGLSEDQRALLPLIVPPVLRAVASDRPVPDITALLTATPSNEPAVI